MQKIGYGVKWIDHYKYITYTTPDGQLFRDNRLLDDKYLKLIWRNYLLMNMEQLKQINQIQTITENTVGALTESIQPIYLLLKPEQYNLLAEHISQTGNAIVRNTDLISNLPTQEGLKSIMTKAMEDNLFQARRIVSEGMNSIRYSVEVQSSNQTDRLREMMHTELKNMKDELKARA